MDRVQRQCVVNAIDLHDETDVIPRDVQVGPLRSVRPGLAARLCILQDWQSYAGECGASALVQTLGLAVQNRLSA